MQNDYYERFAEMFESLGIKLIDTDDKQEIIEADNFIATFTPEKEVANID